MKHRYSNLSLKQKISAMTLLSAIIPLIIFTAISVLLFNHSIKKANEKQIQNNMAVISERIDSYLNSMILCSNNLTVNLNSLDADLTLKPFTRNNLIQSNLNRSLLLFDGIDSIVYFSSDNEMYATNVALYKKEPAIRLSQYFRELVPNKNGKTVLFDHLSDCMETRDNETVITLGKHVTKIGDGGTIGYLFINIKLSQLEQTTDNAITRYMIYDSNSNAITSAGDSDIENVLSDVSLSHSEETIFHEFGSNTYLISRQQIFATQWTLVGITNLSAYNISAYQLIRTIFIAGLILFILLLLGNQALTAMLTKPLETLTRNAEEIKKGNLDVVFTQHSNDEIGKTATALNAMTHEIKKLISQVNEEATKKRTYELALIQEQIKPHFLYNSLDIIIVLNEMSQTKEATRAARKLASYYKNSLASSAEFIPLEKEFAIVEDYLELQLMRYRNQFTYEINLPDALANFSIPRMTLQPLVENSLYHGLKYKEDWGTISVRATQADNCLILIVEDNGIGMTRDTVSRLCSLEEKPESHFGFYSVSHRLRLYYGDKCHIKVESAYYKGTIVTISIPITGEL